MKDQLQKNVSIYDSNKSTNSIEETQMKIEKSYEMKQTQTEENLNESIQTKSSPDDSMSSQSQQDKTMIDDLKINLKIKENLIESINDALVLKEAEIARLKSRIGVMERKKMISELNNENLDEHHKI